MKRAALAAAVGGLLAALGASASASDSARSAVATRRAPSPQLQQRDFTLPLVPPAVHQLGTGFVDQAGSTVYLRGFDANSDMAYKKAALLGANFIRVAIYWSDLEPKPPIDGVHNWDAERIASLDAEVQYLANRNVNVLLDLHQSGWSPYFTNITGNARGMPAWLYSRGYFPQPMSQEGLGMAKKDLATNPAIFPYYRDYAQLIVERYRGFANVVGYELYNEPQPGKLGSNHAGTQALIGFQGRLLQYLRTLDPLRTYVVFTRQGGDLGYLNADISAWAPLVNVALDFHDYFVGLDRPYGLSDDTERWYPDAQSTHTQFETAYVGTYANQLRLLDQVLAKTNEWGIPLIVGEWGARFDDPGLLEYQRQMLKALRARKLSWARWALTSHGSLRILDNGSPTPAALQIQQDLNDPY